MRENRFLLGVITLGLMAICFCFFLVFAYPSSEPDKSVNISSTPIPFNSVIQITETPILSSSTVSPSRTTPTFRPTPKASPSPPPSLTSSLLPLLQPSRQQVNIRSGPGTSYPIIGSLLVGQMATIIARTSDSLWFNIQLSDGLLGWVSAEVTEITGFLEAKDIVVVLTIPLAVTVPAISQPIPPQTMTTESFGTVTKVVDGDTIDVNINGIIYRVRYIGMNTPETNEVCGNDATTANSALVANQSIRLVKDLSEVDRYGRLLRYVYVGDLFVNAELIKQGWAEAAAYPPDITYASYFEELELQAASANLACYATGVFGNGSAVIFSTPTFAFDAPPISDISVCSCSRNSYNCPNFSTHDQAQACFNYCMQTVGYDVHRLDRDNDGLACENLP